MLKTYPDAVADVIRFRVSEGDAVDMTVDEWLAFAHDTSFHAARARARSMGIDIACLWMETKTADLQDAKRFADLTSESASRTLMNACRVTPSRRAS